LIGFVCRDAIMASGGPLSSWLLFVVGFYTSNSNAIVIVRQFEAAPYHIVPMIFVAVGSWRDAISGWRHR
jgi:hypothetical protein